MKVQAGDDFSSGGNFLTEEGTYHLLIAEATEEVLKKDGSHVPDACFRCECVVLAGTTGGQEEKEVQLTWFHPNSSHKDGGKMAQKKIDRFLVSIGLLVEGDQGKEIEVDLNEAVGRQFVAKLLPGRDPRFMDIAYTDIWHVDDPAVKAIPKAERGLERLPAEQRMIGEQQPATQPPKPQPEAAAAVTFDDI